MIDTVIFVVLFLFSIERMEEDESNDFDGEQYIQDYLEKDDYIYEEAIHILSLHLIG